MPERRYAYRPSRGEVYEPSYPDGYGLAAAFADTLARRRPLYYFRRLRLRRRSFLGVPLPPRMERDGYVWTPEDGREWEPVTEARARALLAARRSVDSPSAP